MNANWHWPIVVETFTVLCFAITTATCILLSFYYRYTRPLEPDVNHKWVCGYEVNGRTVFLTKGEVTFLTTRLFRFASVFWTLGLVAALAIAAH
jgi:hypothetical protein